MEDKKVPTSDFFADQANKQCPDVLNQDNVMNHVMELEVEMEKRKIRNELIAYSEIMERKQIKAEVRLKLMVEEEMMGMRRFLSALQPSSVLMGSDVLRSQFQSRPFCDRKLFNLGLSDDENQKFINHNTTTTTSSVVENNVDQKEKIQDVPLGRWPFERDPGLVAAQFATNKLDLFQANPSPCITGMKRKAETSIGPSDKEMASIGAKGSQKKWYCSLCEVSATSEVALNLHFQGKKHKAREAKSEASDAASSINIGTCSIEKSQKPKESAAGAATVQEKTPISSKFYCCLCQVCATSETLLQAHLQGKKHKAKEAKLDVAQNVSKMDDCSTEKFDKVGANVKTEAVKKWYCSLCQVSALSEKNLNDHLQGKKHKAKEGALGEETGSVDSNLGDEVSELVQTMREQDVKKGGQIPINEQESNNTTPQQGENASGHDETNNVGLDKLESPELHLHGSVDTEDVNSAQDKENEQESSLKTREDTDKLGNVCYLNKETSSGNAKYWYCHMCNQGTCDEETMAAHRKSNQHITLLHKNGGNVIAVSRISKEALDGAKCIQE